MWITLACIVVGIGVVQLVAYVYMHFNGGIHTTRNGFIGIEKKPEEIDAMIARVKKRQARYDAWRAKLGR